MLVDTGLVKTQKLALANQRYPILDYLIGIIVMEKPRPYGWTNTFIQSHPPKTKENLVSLPQSPE
jgi:hypothetical protein